MPPTVKNCRFGFCHGILGEFVNFTVWGGPLKNADVLKRKRIVLAILKDDFNDNKMVTVDTSFYSTLLPSCIIL